MRPSAIKSSGGESGRLVWKETSTPSVGDGSACAMVSMHIAISGQSRQLLLFWPSGQQGIASDIAAISVISATARRFAAAGVTSGAATSPTITKTATRRPMSRRRFITRYPTGPGTWEGPSLHMFARGVSLPKKGYRLTEESTSTRYFGTDKLHK